MMGATTRARQAALAAAATTSSSANHRRDGSTSSHTSSSPTASSPSPVNPSNDTTSAKSAAGLHENERAAKAAPGQRALVHRTHVPAHLQFNKFVDKHYRPLHTIAEVPAYLFFTLHNETLNIASHLACALLFIYWVLTGDYDLQTASGALMLINDVACAVCMGCSAVYHTFMSTAATPAEYAALLGLDVAGIWVTQLGGALSLYFLLLPCAPWQLVYAIALGPSVASLVILCRGGGIRGRAVGFLIAQAARIIVPLVAVTGAASHWDAPGLTAHIAVELAAILGGAINAARVPERWWPGAFDRLNSHTLMHFFVAVNLLGQHFMVAQRAAVIEMSAAASLGGIGGGDPTLSQCLSLHVPDWVRAVARLL